MLGAMFSGRHTLNQEPDGSYFIDRDGTHFADILNYLRDGYIVVPSNSDHLQKLLIESKYYLLDGLSQLLVPPYEPKVFRNNKYESWGRFGYMFKITAHKKLTITGLALMSRAAGDHPVTVFGRKGSYLGCESLRSGWTSLYSGITQFANQIPTKVVEKLNIELNNGEMYSIAIFTPESANGAIMCGGSHGNATSTTGNEDLTISSGPTFGTATQFVNPEPHYQALLLGEIMYNGQK